MAAHFGDDEGNVGSPVQKAGSAIGRETGRIEQLRGTNPANIRCIDTETTGLEPGKDEILQVSVVNGNGDVLFDSLVKPTHRKRWPKAAEVNGITPDMVKGKPNIEDVADDIERAMDGAELLVGYNLEFDTSMLDACGVSLGSHDTFDVMKEYASVHGKWNDYYNDYSFVKLTTAAHHYGIKLNPHDSSEDAVATVRVFEKLLQDDAYASRAREHDEAVERQREARAKAEAEKEEKATDKHVKKTADVFFLVCFLAYAVFLLATSQIVGALVAIAFCALLYHRAKVNTVAKAPRERA